MALSKNKIVYADMLGEAWSTLKKNPIIFSPTLYGLVAVIVFALLLTFFAWISGTSVFLSSLFSVLIVLSALFVFVHIISVQMFIMSRLALEKKVRFKEAMCAAKDFMPRIVVLVLLIVLALIPAIIILSVFALPLLLMLKAPETANILIGSISLILTFIVGLALFFLFKAWTIFAFPKLVYEKKKPKVLLSETWSLMWKKDRKNVWSSFFIVFGIGLGVNIIFAALNKIINPAGITSMSPGIIIFQLINLLVSIVIGLWLTLFVYKVFVKRYGVKGK